jgi:6,7-dimethyl-8-ribityllumazine synthase
LTGTRFTTEDPEITEKKLKLKVEPVPEAAIPAVEGKLDAAGRRFAIVVARFNAFITERLLLSACDGLLRTGAAKKDIVVVRVPGAFEIPSAARTLALTKKYDAIVCIGCLLRGDTAHYDVIVNEVTRGIGQSAQETGVPHAFGVLTCDRLEQAIDRAGLKMGNKGFEAALAAVEMASLAQAISSQPSPISEKRNVGRRRSDLGQKQISSSARNDKLKSRNDRLQRRNGKPTKRAPSSTRRK